MYLYKFINFLISLPRSAKILIVLAVDASLCIFATWISFYLRLGEFISFQNPVGWKPHLAALGSLFSAIPLFLVIGFYRSIFRYTGVLAAITITRTIIIYGLIYAAIFTVIGFSGVPRTIGLIQPVLLLIFILTTRAAARFWLGGIYLDYFGETNTVRVMIYGVGIEGRQLADALANSHDMRLVGFLDDDTGLKGKLLNSKPIFTTKNLESLTKSLGVRLVLLANPKTNLQKRNQIIQKLARSKVSVRTLPSVNELVQGMYLDGHFRELEIGDLLGRDPIPPDVSLLKKNITGKVVLVTGAGGSIGSELCKQILNLNPRILILVDASEYALYTIDNTLREAQEKNKTEIISLLARVQDRDRMHEIIAAWKPGTLYHAAAYKHVPLVEYNPLEGISNNVFGTLVLADLAIRHEVCDFVLISTDKAVRPTSIMGVTKRLAEMILQSLAVNSQNTNFSMVRFGNVLGSSGSVVPRFREQIQRGGPITLTHVDITRYFMTLTEAAQLVIQAGAMAQGGEVFVLDMGEPVRIFDLAKSMVELSGNTLRTKDNPNGDVAIEITGLRPGEKLFEELLIGGSSLKTEHPRIMKANESFLEWDVLTMHLERLRGAVETKNVEDAITYLKSIVTNFTQSEGISDWVYVQNRRN